MSTAKFDGILPRPSFNLGPASIAFALIGVGGVYLTATVTWRQGALFLVGGASAAGQIARARGIVVD